MNKYLARLIPIIISAFLVQCEIIPLEEEQSVPPIACFNTDKDTYAVGEIVTFNNCSQNADQYGWLFNSGESTTENSTVYAPTYTYESPGYYTISLTVFNNQLNDVVAKTIEITDNNQPQYVNVTFAVNMSVQIALDNFNPAFENVLLESNQNDWGNNEIKLLDNDKNDIYEVTLFDIEVGTEIEYLFKINETKKELYTRQHTVQASGNRLEHTYNDETGIPIVPEDYFGIPAWTIYYYDDFEEPGGWKGTSFPEVSSVIENGVYKVTVGELTYHWATFPTDIKMPSESENFDIEIRFRYTQNNQTTSDVRGTCLIWAVDTTNWNHNWYYVDPLGAYLIQSNFASAYWMGGNWLSGANPMSDMNLLTVRKYEDRYYFFLNSNYLFDVPFDSYAGDMLGFKVGSNYSVEVEDYGVFLMELSNSATKKSKNKLLLNRN